MKGWLLVVEDDLIMGESLADRFAQSLEEAAKTL